MQSKQASFESTFQSGLDLTRQVSRTSLQGLPCPSGLSQLTKKQLDEHRPERSHRHFQFECQQAYGLHALMEITINSPSLIFAIAMT